MGKRVQNFNLKNLETKVINLGYVGENVHTQIVIECSEVLWDYPNAVASMVVQPPRGDLYPVEVTREENNIIWEITASDVVYAGSGRVQLTFTNDGEIVKSAVGTTRISGSIEATGEAPEPLQNWMDQAEETAHQIALTAKDEVIDQIQDAAEEARESIPADYTQLSDDVSGLKSAFEQLDANVITESAGPAPIVSVTDGADGMPMRKVEVAIEPVQDLHGYDCPWPAGGGKNLLEATATTNTINGLTFTVNEDGTVLVNGTATADTTFAVGTWISTGEQIVLNGCPIGGSTSTYRLFADHIGTDTGAGLTKTPEAGQNCPVKVSIYNGVTANNLLYKPMIRLATETDATYAPYSNICPISGWTGAKVTRTGINIWGEEWELGNISPTTGTNASSTERIRSVAYIAVRPSTEYYFKAPSSLGLRYYDANKNFIGSSTVKNSVRVIPDNCYYLRFVLLDSTTYNHDVSINYPATDTEYHPGHAQTYEVTFPSEAGTVYGGTLDVVSGKLVVDRASVTLNGSDGESYTNVSSANGARIAIPISNDSIVWTDQSAITRKLWCDTFKEMSNSSTFGGAIGIHYRTNGTHSIIISFGKLIPSDNIYAGAKAWFAQNPTTIVYALAETKEYTLTTNEITTLLGINNVFADCGDTAITYPADTKMYIDRKITEAVANALNA